MPPPKPKVSKAFLDTMAAHRRTLDRILDKRSVKGLQKLYDAAQSEMAKKLAKLTAAGRKETMTALQLQQMRAQVKEGQARIAAKLANAMKPITKDTAADAIRQAAKSITDLEKKFTGADLVLPLEEAATFRGLIQGREQSLIRMHQTSFAKYGTTLTQKMEEQLSLALITGETPMGAIDRVMEVAGNEWWQAERIVRTETAYAFNASHADAIEEASSELPDLYQRWTEYVNDTTGQPLDDRVAEDSLVLHGQVVRAGEKFIMPPDPRVSQKMWNQQYAHPPNRPNDRAVLLPWRPGWPAPAWKWRDGQRVALK